MGVGRGKELKIVKYGHHEEAIPASKLPNISFLLNAITNIFTEESLNINQLPWKYGD